MCARSAREALPALPSPLRYQPTATRGSFPQPLPPGAAGLPGGLPEELRGNGRARCPPPLRPHAGRRGAARRPREKGSFPARHPGCQLRRRHRITPSPPPFPRGHQASDKAAPSPAQTGLPFPSSSLRPWGMGTACPECRQHGEGREEGALEPDRVAPRPAHPTRQIRPPRARPSGAVSRGKTKPTEEGAKKAHPAPHSRLTPLPPPLPPSLTSCLSPLLQP